MRTTIEITDEQRSQLLAIAAARGMKGFSSLVREALDEYLAARARDQERLERAMETRGTLSEQDARALLKTSRELRETWR